ncbi:alpha/beta fold hydrolase [Streptomyces sp. NPDC020794]|uniref:alpha/beta fold hydrolase n=1 Tax=unclassified Streptomyces TaxID=2593676 RepID=UPI0036E96D26
MTWSLPEPMLTVAVEIPELVPSRARSTYEDEGLPGSLVPYADVLVALSGADHVAAGLMYEGAPTLSARWGLQLCAAVDRAGFAAPWEAYLTAWDKARGGASAHDGSAGDEAVFLAELRGRIRLPGHGADKRESQEDHPLTLAQRVARFLDQEALDSPEPALGVLLDCFGAEPLLESAELIERPERRAALLLHLADAHDGAGGMLPSARTLAAAAWASAPCGPRRLLDHGVPVADLAEEVFRGDVTTVLQEATHAVLTGRYGDLSGPVSRWLELLAVAQAADVQAPARLLPLLDGEGFYRAWLRFAIATLGLGRDVDAGRIPAERASTAARVALEQLARHAAAFTGRPNASELGDIHRLAAGREVPTSVALHLRAAIPRARLAELPGADHFAFATRPALVNALLLSFIDEPDDPRTA